MSYTAFLDGGELMGHSEGALLNSGLVVLNYNNATETVNFLHNVASISCIGSVQVVDNASSDDSADRINECLSDVGDSRFFFVQACDNGGYGKGNNLGVSSLLNHAPCKYILIANPDTQFDAQAVKSLVDFLDVNIDYGAVAPLMLKPSGEHCQSAWKLPNRLTLFLGSVRLLLPFLPDPFSYGVNYELINEPLDVDVLPGSLFLIRAEAFERVGGFDEDTFLYGEENLLFAKLGNVGYKSAILPACTYVHAHGTTINREFSSVNKRYLMLLDSNTIYAKKILKVGPLYLFVYSLLFKIGALAFSLMLTIRDRLSSCRSVSRGGC